ncbi:hypothetical protein CAPTEDRAFT_214988 [Capitella teleta]|uniref:VWFA domain-containing protein n=1 Tax=Capitella teleta TaxID=283909 RepID=R7TED3_CAPTE|nr:hypothetical protein CAPTEDRAFT_214988 [Capitella teleta]|eukprot:ELT92128.1 hypothetical protein CAPTEDRAFT_214988 [Capitella teleta]
MDFGSKFVYDYCESEEELISEDEMQEGMATTLNLHSDSSGDDLDGSDSDAEDRTSRPKSSSNDPDDRVKSPGDASQLSNNSAAEPKRARGLLGFMQRFRGTPNATESRERFSKSNTPAGKKEKRIMKKKKKGKKSSSHTWMRTNEAPIAQGATGGHRWRRADTNVVSVKFDHLESMSNMHTGDPTHCTQCDAVLSHLSKLTPQEDDVMSWKCEFCGCANELEICPEEQPLTEDVTFLIHAAPPAKDSSLDDSLVIFCVDVSGSMNTTTECVQAAVDAQLQALQNEHPKLRVCLISFSTKVKVIGCGGKNSSRVICSTDNWDTLKAEGLGVEIPQPIESTRESLKSSVYELETEGMTALGPALLVAVALASKAAGSKVVMCTDGLANLGIGSLDSSSSEIYSVASSFYSDVITLAKENSTSISVITLKDTDCRLAELGRLANETGGKVNIVDPLKLTTQFSSVMADAIIATNVTASLLLHHDMYFRHEEEAENNRVERKVGSVSSSTEVTFEFGMKKKRDYYQVGEKLAADLKEVPFQLVIHYTDQNGAEALRVITSCHAAQKSGKWAAEGEYSKSRKAAMMYQRLLHRNRNIDHHVYDNFLGNVGQMENYLNLHQQKEIAEHGLALSEEEDEVYGTEDQGQGSKQGKQKKMSKALQRRMRSADDSANTYYSHAQCNSSMFKKK